MISFTPHMQITAHSVIELLTIFDEFSSSSKLKPNKSNGKIAEIDILKEFKLELCGLKCLNPENKTAEILGCH